MKKIALVIAGITGLALLTAGAVVFVHADKNTGGTTGAAITSGGYRIVAACKAFTLTDATAVLGEGARAGSANGGSDTQSDDVAVSTCSYSGAPGMSAQDTKTITLLARSAKTAAGATSNKSFFTTNKPVGKQDLGGIGDAAFWDPELSQLDILKGNNWYIIGNMSGTHADSGSLDVARTVYDHIGAKL